MTEEEKAKAYDEALKRAKNLYNSEETSADIEIACEYIFPELKESEDERIRKAIYNAIKYLETEHSWDFLDDVDILDAYTWLLEKQDTFNKKDVDDAYLKGITDAKNEIEKQYEANYQIRKDIATFLFNYKGDIKDRSKWMNYLGIKVSFVEKQGEKPQGKSALEAVNEEKVDNQNCVKPADKVEPKFKVGDWVVDNCSCVWKIEGILNQFYVLECPEGGESRPTIEWVDRNFHLWTIQDAKDGDVLSANWRAGANFWEKIIIFKKYHSKGVKGAINAPYVEGYGNTLKNGKLIPCAKVPYYSYYSTRTDNLYPATKEQRDLLFQNLKEAGYKWDADNKELKKIEKKLEEKLTNFLSLKDFQEAFELKAKQYDIELPNRGYDIHAMCKELYSLLIKPKPTWNEEDEKN